MTSERLFIRYALLVVPAMILALGSSSKSQEYSEGRSDIETLQKAEADIARLRAGETLDVIDTSRRAWLGLAGIIKRNPNSELRFRIEPDMLPLEEILGNHDLEIAKFYLSREHRGTKGAKDRLLNIVQNYPRFSRMDEVLLDLANASLRDDDSEAARDYLWKAICRYPTGAHVNSAFDRLNQIGFGVWKGCDDFRQ